MSNKAYPTRERKFKAFRTDTKQMSPPYLISEWAVRGAGFLSNWNAAIEYLIFLEFTGLFDCNKSEGHPDGCEIYEDDLVECNMGHFGRYLCKIAWDNGGFYFEPIRPLTKDSGDFPQRFVNWEYVIDPIIVGNIHTNPELLNQKAHEPTAQETKGS